MAPVPVPPGRGARDVVERHAGLADAARSALDDLDGARLEVVDLVEAEREAVVHRELARIGVDRLGDLTDKNLRVRALLEAGYATALDVYRATPGELEAHEGIGPHTARGVVAATQQLADAVRGGVRTRIRFRGASPDMSAGAPADAVGTAHEHGTALLRALQRVLHLGPLVEPHRRDLDDYSGSVTGLARAAAPATNRFTWAFRAPGTKARARSALAALVGWEPWLTSTGLPATVARLAAERTAGRPGAVALWDDFERRSAEYYTTLAEIVPLGADVALAHGMVPAELAERVEAHPLDQSLLRVRLRGYQAFGARFALNQGRALLGDEMGLGKTVQAIAALAHRAAAGDRHLLVVCPASVLVGWLREIAAHSLLTGHRIHGPGRDEAAAAWVREGGVAVTTFDGLQHVPEPGPADGWEVGMLVVDEAHLVKNHAARRSRAVARRAAGCLRVLFLTGTPMENRLEEFLALVHYLQPGLVDRLPRHLGLTGSDRFRQEVAPAYLRRNTEDVLVELPDLVRVEEWEELTPAQEVAYREAVAAGNLMGMRRAAYVGHDGTGSGTGGGTSAPLGPDEPYGPGKLGRLLEIVAEARDSGRRTIVFSFFRDVVDLVATAVAEVTTVHGPLTGSVPAGRRQEIVDAFSDGPVGAVLVAQVQAGGVGLNVQAASVVVLCEPQLTPATEAQAVARAHRMGQVRTVHVHRLLAEGTVDERILEILDEKERVFDEYVRDSELAASVASAVDVTEAQLAREVVAAEQARWGYGPVWDELQG